MTLNNKRQFCIRYPGLLLILLLNFNCRTTPDTPAIIHNYIKPQYNLIQLLPTHDTLHFALDENSYNAIKSALVFILNDKEYICFQDQRAEAFIIYDLNSKHLIKRLDLKKIFSGHTLYKPTAFIKNFDSIFIANKTSLYLIDSTGHFKKSIKFLQNPEVVWAVFDNTNPPIFKDNQLFAGVRPYVKETSLPSLAKWKVLYSFDISKGKAKLNYSLPVMYRKNYYGYHFFDYNYCYNNNGNFVFSFPADSNIYESDLAGRHISYCGRSQYQIGDITPLTKEELLNDKEGKQYLLRDSYGPIYFDHYNKRYLRLAKQKISESEYESKTSKRKRSVLIFNEQFKIIGETPIDDNISFSTIFFTADGSIYARTRASDEYALHFVRLAYQENPKNDIQLSKN